MCGCCIACTATASCCHERPCCCDQRRLVLVEPLSSTYPVHITPSFHAKVGDFVPSAPCPLAPSKVLKQCGWSLPPPQLTQNMFCCLPTLPQAHRLSQSHKNTTFAVPRAAAVRQVTPRRMCQSLAAALHSLHLLLQYMGYTNPELGYTCSDTCTHAEYVLYPLVQLRFHLTTIC